MSQDTKYFVNQSSDDSYIKDMMDDFYQDAITINQAYHAEGDLDVRCEAGDSSLNSETFGSVGAFQRHTIGFNHVRPIINVVDGYQQAHRKSTIVTPQESGDQDTADQFTSLLMWQYQREGVNEIISEAFRGALITGMNFLELSLDFRNDPVSGDLKFNRVGYNGIIVDPYFRKLDLSDCRALWKRSFLARPDIMSLWPDMANDILKIPSGTMDGKFQYMPENFQANYRNLMAYDEFHYRTYRPQKLLYDPNTGKSFEWKSENSTGLRDFLMLYPNIKVIDQTVPTVHTAILVEGEVIYNGANPLGIDAYNFVPVVSYYQSDIPYYPLRVQGMVRMLRTPQALYNHRRIVELEVLESQVNSGWVYKVNAPLNPADMYASGQGVSIPLKDDANIGDIVKIQPAHIDPSFFTMSDALANEMMKVTGVNEAAMGSAIDDKAGIVEMVRQRASLSSLQSLFSNLDRAQKILGNLVLTTMQTNFTAAKVERILRKEPAPEFYNKDFGLYDCAIEEGFNTTTQRQLQFAMMLQLRDVGVPIEPSDLIEAATIQNKSQIIANMQKREQQTQQQQQQAQQQQAQLIQANAHAQQSLGDERLSRIDENHALATERLAQADRDDMSGLLDMVKALKEIQSMDLAGIEKLLLLGSIAKSQRREEEQEDAQQLPPLGGNVS